MAVATRSGGTSPSQAVLRPPVGFCPWSSSMTKSVLPAWASWLDMGEKEYMEIDQTVAVVFSYNHFVRFVPFIDFYGIIILNYSTIMNCILFYCRVLIQIRVRVI